ncbi:uncharacterized protein BXZ73DRAFT_93508 [Epithele typhae]|uniref:uncharacterized protein n=1 Tax=Epithele typhae TaxID=378194 RepID=UPI0020079E48|nr:uncharacterized protein BXZ73DRAFT_93508 [Epithele typhae]KAH9910924.1 hypothetical protein BXZ73DRAFT_93508 [Epithele typhae]
MVVTSPNQDWIPTHPVERKVVRTYQDGLWGEHEYSRWPQPIIRGMWHVACIPSLRHPHPLMPPILWSLLMPSRDWVEDGTVGVPGLGFLKADVRNDLTNGARYATDAFQQVSGLTPERRAYGDQLCLVVSQCLDRMNRLPSYAPVAVAVGAHLQRVGLELLGLRTYLTVLLPRLDSAEDYSEDLLPVLGVFARDAATAQLATRVGLPVWFLQPLSPQVKVWNVVDRTFPYFLSGKETDPPMRHHPDELGAIANLTSSWVSNLVFAVTGQLCTSRLPRFDITAADTHTREDDGPMKTRRLELPATEMQAPPTRPGDGPKKKTRRGGKKSKSVVTSAASSSAVTLDHSPEARHPARSFTPSSFVLIPEPWEAALRSVSPLGQPRHSVHYFYPPPFLLDTVSDMTPSLIPPAGADQLRRDTKVHQYLHNAVRIREFCRLRLLDPLVSGEPLTIAEWRAALWGDYEVKHAPPESTDRRLKRKIENKNGVARLFGNGAALDSYNSSAVEHLNGIAVTAEVAATDPRVRALLLWESHEVNFRCELSALDASLVPRAAMSVMERWGREAYVSGVWGPEASLASVPFMWPRSHDGEWENSVLHLRRFISVMSQWPDSPGVLRQMRTAASWTSEDYDHLQREAALFYVTKFTSCYGRLPIPPIPCQTD